MKQRVLLTAMGLLVTGLWVAAATAGPAPAKDMTVTLAITGMT